jgi:hypothetical protein
LQQLLHNTAPQLQLLLLLLAGRLPHPTSVLLPPLPCC